MEHLDIPLDAEPGQTVIEIHRAVARLEHMILEGVSLAGESALINSIEQRLNTIYFQALRDCSREIDDEFAGRVW